MDLIDPALSYYFGFAQTDGTLSVQSRNRGRLSIELARSDEEVLRQLAASLPCSSTLTWRTRDTNFKKGYESSVLSVFDRAFRDLVCQWGLPVGRKDMLIGPPTVAFSEVDYVRGLIDGDGSLGFTERGLPFLSLVTSSDALADFYVGFLHRTIGGRRKTTSRNRRDQVYNIAVFKEGAQAVAARLYYEGCLSFGAQARRCEGYVRVGTAGGHAE